MNWDDHFMGLAKSISTRSEDSTKLGCVLVSPTHKILSVGCNEFPHGTIRSPERTVRPSKYLFTEHAERNAIYSAARNGTQLDGSTAYVSWFPCADCARALVQSGIRRVVVIKPNFQDPKWGVDFVASLVVLEEGGIVISYHDSDPPVRD